MPQFDSPTRTKIDALRALRAANTTIYPYEIVRVNWADGVINYAVLQTDEVADPPPPFAIDCSLIPQDNPAWFLPLNIGATIGDEEVDLQFQDFDGAFGDLLYAEGEGVKVEFFYWFPQAELLLPVWEGRLQLEDETDGRTLPVKVAQGFMAADRLLPSGGHYQECQSPFPPAVPFTTQAEIDQHSCNYNLHIGGGIGIENPATSEPFTFCPRRVIQDCIDRGIDPLRHQSHRTVRITVLNQQTQGPNLFSTSNSNATFLKEPPRVVMGTRRVYGLKVLDFRRDLNNNNPDHGWFAAIYEGGYGPVGSISGAVIGGQSVIGMHYHQKLGEFGQTSVASDLTTHGYSGIWLLRYNLGWVNPAEIDPSSIDAHCLTTGQSKIRTYTDADTYTEGTSRNRVWQIMHAMTNKTWGVGRDYDHFNIENWIEAAEWAETSVQYTDSDGNTWDHLRAASDVDLPGKKMQQQIDDMCKAGRLSRPFLFDGKIHIEPLKALTEDELAACPVFTDEGSTRNIIVDADGLSTLRISRKNAIDLPNRIECTYDDAQNNYVETPAPPVEDVDAQHARGKAMGKKDRDVNTKSHTLLGVTSKAQSVKMAFSILDLGEFDEGGLRNNCRVKFSIWFMDALDLHPHKVIKVVNTRLNTRYGFEYFRILSEGLKRESNLYVEVEAQAYPVEYMDTFETSVSPPPTVVCSVDADCGPNARCVNGVCVPIIEPPPPCEPIFGEGVAVGNNLIEVPIDPCL